jgi:hypothetical protein
MRKQRMRTAPMRIARNATPLTTSDDRPIITAG